VVRVNIATTADIVRATGRLVAGLTPAQLARVRAEADRRGMYVTEYLRVRIVPHVLARRGLLMPVGAA